MIGGARGFILGYHDVVATTTGSSGFQTAAAWRYKLSEPNFRRHVEAVSAVRPEAPSVFRHATEVPAIGAPYALTFDDGGVSSQLVADILEEQGWRGSFFVPTSFIGSKGFLTPRAIAELVRRGHVVGSHSHSHPSMMARLDPGVLRAEWTTSVAILEGIIESAVTTASVPGGSTSAVVEQVAAACGIEVLFTSEPRARGSVRDGYVVLGRYPLYATDRADTAAAIVRGDVGRRLARTGAWNARKVGKKLLGRQYLRLRGAAVR